MAKHVTANLVIVNTQIRNVHVLLSVRDACFVLVGKNNVMVFIFLILERIDLYGNPEHAFLC